MKKSANSIPRRLDVLILGAGTAGLSAQAEVAKKTDRYLVVDPGPLGTTCARVGCMPAKTLVQVANDFHQRHKAKREGVRGTDSLSVNGRDVLKYIREWRDEFVGSVLSGMEPWMKTHFVASPVEWIDFNTVRVGEQDVWAKKIILAMGSSPRIPSEWKLFEDFILTTDSLFELEEFPSSVAVIGLGAVGIETGQALHRLGINVILIQDGKKLGGITDPRVLEQAVQTFSEEIPLTFEGVKNIRIKDSRVHFESGRDSYSVEKVLLCTGRRPNLGNLERLGLVLNDKGVPAYDRTTMNIWSMPLYLAGDVDADLPVLHEAALEGKIAGQNAVSDVDRKFKRMLPLSIVFSSPQIAKVGASYQELEGQDFVTGEEGFESGRALIQQEPQGLLRIYVDPHSRKVLGGELFGPDCEHLAHLLAWGIQMDFTLDQFIDLPYYHPVNAERLRSAFKSARRKIPR